MRELHAWENGHHVGVFSEDDEERISFAYDANEGLPISLSLPRTGGWRDQAPRNFLDNLLPDNPNVRQAMREHLNASSAGVFDLLDRVDATGGLVFSLSPEPPIPSPTLRLISDSQIANEIDRIEQTRNYWWDEDSHCRFSLGGAQGKFTLSRVDGKWYRPDMMLPSTHIVKPKPHDLPRGDQGGTGDDAIVGTVRHRHTGTRRDHGAAQDGLYRGTVRPSPGGRPNRPTAARGLPASVGIADPRQIRSVGR